MNQLKQFPGGLEELPGRVSSQAPYGIPPRSGRHRTGFWAVAVIFAVTVAFSTVPTPLYPLYEERDGFGSFTVTVVFAVYAVGVAAGLVSAGHLSDRTGRRPVLVAALLFELAAAALFLVWPALPGLLLARFITGLGVGMATPTATPYLQDLHIRAWPGAGQSRFEAVSTAANVGGLGVGPLGAGLLAAYAPAPIRTPYIVFAVFLAAGIAAVAVLPETVDRPGRPVPYRVQRVRSYGGAALFCLAVACASAALAIFGLFTSLAPGFVADTLHQSSPAVAGAAVFAVFAAAVLGQSLSGALSPAVRQGAGVAAEAAGCAAVVAGMALADPALFIAGGVIAGIGAGMLFKAAVALVARAAPAEVRAEALATFFLAAYTGLVVTSLGLGLAAQLATPTTATLWFSGFLAVLLAAIALLGRTAGGGRHRSSPGPLSP
ncbi:MFS transporter [Streptomyces sp. NBC_01186]|uniref:MFS transporter n=1 Tax=Streptomyces sp. NBC_01186 TaxID=2903765 RepID=UPI002E0D8F11|nr:MFS transporter [Streptomyces sp. NBC_01186]